MSYQLMAWAAEQRTGSPTKKAVLMALANAANHHTGVCCPSIERIAEETELGDSTVRRALKELADEGVVKRKRRRRDDGSLSVYDFEFPEAARARTPPLAESSDPPLALSAQEPGVNLEPGEPSPTARDSQPSAPALKRIDGRDIAFDALARACKVAERSPRLGEVGVALNGKPRARPPTIGIRDQYWRENAEGFFESAGGVTGEDFERALAAEIPKRAQVYHAVMKGATLTPLALAKWWSDLPEMAREASIEGFYDHARDAVERARGGSDAG